MKLVLVLGYVSASRQIDSFIGGDVNTFEQDLTLRLQHPNLK